MSHHRRHWWPRKLVHRGQGRDRLAMPQWSEETPTERGPYFAWPTGSRPEPVFVETKPKWSASRFGMRTPLTIDEIPSGTRWQRISEPRAEG